MKSEKQKQNPTQSPGEMVVGESRRVIPWRLIIAGLIIVIGAGVYFGYQHAQQVKREAALLDNDKSVEGLSDDYLLLTPAQAATKLKIETGLDLDTLAGQKLTDKSFRNFKQANKAAQALYAAGRYDQSYQAFKIAAKSVPKDVDYHFYLNYASLADLKGDQKLKLELANKAKEAIKHDGSLSAARKATEIDRIDQKL